MFVSPRCLWVRSLLLGLVLAAGTGRAQDEVTSPEPSDLAPLAERSLLLDAASAGDRVVVVGDRGHVLISTDGARNWKQVVVPARSMLNAVVLQEDGQGWAVGHDAVILHTADGGESWELQHWAPEREQPLFDVWFSDGENGIAIGAYGLYLETRDGGKTWTQRTINEDEPHFYQLASGTSGALYMVGEFGTLYRSADEGTTWEQSESPYEGSFFGALVVSDDAVLVFGLRGNLFRSRDRGESWEAARSGAEAGLFDGALLADGSVVLVGQGGAMSISGDGGQTFASRHLDSRHSVSAILPLDPQRILLVGEAGIEVLETGEALGTAREGGRP